MGRLRPQGAKEEEEDGEGKGEERGRKGGVLWCVWGALPAVVVPGRAFRTWDVAGSVVFGGCQYETAP